MRVYISYSADASVEYCFWKYFFRSCGIWMTSEVITEEWQLDREKNPHLIILDKEDENKIGKDSCEGVVYCVRKSSKIDKNREDIVKVIWWNEFHYQILNKLFIKNKDIEKLRILLDIFYGTENSKKERDEKLWGVSWLFHEIGQNITLWDAEIELKVREAIEILNSKKKIMGNYWHYQYMLLYCKYILCGISRSQIRRIDGCEKLLTECDVFGKERGWNPTLYILEGKIALLTPTYNKYALSYFKCATKYEKQAMLYYEIGRIYEKAYGDNEKALTNYWQAFKCNSNYYRALYKFAIDMEIKGEWMKALAIYIDIQKILLDTKGKYSISIRELEYEYKTCKRMVYLFRNYINNDKILEDLQSRIVKMSTNIEEYVDFSKLLDKMFETENQDKKLMQIKAELRNKLLANNYG